MKRTIPFLFLIAGLSTVSGYLMSKASWIGRVGITFLHQEYNLLKIWWQGSAAVFVVMLALFLLHHFIQKKTPFIAAKFLHLILLAAAIGCLYLTYDDFTNDFSHHLLGRRFHYGFYLAWTEWILICVFFLLKKRTSISVAINPDKKELIKV